jgi:hypothetical protein
MTVEEKLQTLREVVRDCVVRVGLRQTKLLELIDELDEQITHAVDDAANVGAMAISQAARDILAGRARQVRLEGWTPAYDDDHENCELADAAACYALHSSDVQIATIAGYGPGDSAWWEPTTARRMLGKTGTLIIAKTERIDRAALPASPEKASCTRRAAQPL